MFGGVGGPTDVVPVRTTDVGRQHQLCTTTSRPGSDRVDLDELTSLHRVPRCVCGYHRERSRVWSRGPSPLDESQSVDPGLGPRRYVHTWTQETPGHTYVSFRQRDEGSGTTGAVFILVSGVTDVVPVVTEVGI